jgi:hypothetical protein
MGKVLPRRQSWFAQSCHAARLAGPAFHEPLYRAASHMATFTVQLSPDFVSAVDLHIGLPNPFNFWIQHVITLGASTTQCRIPLLCSIASIA